MQHANESEAPQFAYIQNATDLLAYFESKASLNQRLFLRMRR